MTKIEQPEPAAPIVVLNRDGVKVPADTLPGFDPRFGYDSFGQAFLDGRHVPGKAIGMASQWHNSPIKTTGQGATV